MQAGTSFALLSEDTDNHSGPLNGTDGGAAIELPYRGGQARSAGDAAGAPIHATLFRTDAATSKPFVHKAMAVWIAFTKPEAAECSAEYGHCCTVSNEAAGSAGHPVIAGDGCTLQPPSWQCFSAPGVVWNSISATDGKKESIYSINYLGSLSAPQPSSPGNHSAARRSATMADGQPLLVHFEAGATLPYPLSNSYAEHTVVDSKACRRLCDAISSNPTAVDLYTDTNAAGCMLAAQPSFKAVSGFGL